MDTRFCRLEGTPGDEEIFRQAGDIIRAGGLVAFPTETVYGLGGDALNGDSSTRIYAAKGRPSDNPLIVHIDDMNRLPLLSEQVPEQVYALGEVFWPGPLTMIMKKSAAVPEQTTGGLDTVAVRMPSHRGALSFIEASGGYIAAPSANLSGRPSPTSALHVLEDLSGRIEMIIDGGEVGIGLESTIVDLTGDVPMILRPGYIGMEKLSRVLGEVRTDPGLEQMQPVTAGNATAGAQSPETDQPRLLRPKAPGMKYTHYAPKGELIIVKGSRRKVADRINRLVKGHLDAGESAGVIATAENLELYTAGCIKCAGERSNDETIARRLFAILREFDKEGIMHIYSEELDTPVLGGAIMNRLMKAASHRVMVV